MNSTIEANQSGLIAEPLVDVTPQLPIPDYKVRVPPPHRSLSAPPAESMHSLLSNFPRSRRDAPPNCHVCVDIWQAGPLDPDCAKEGKILCSQGRIQGQPGERSRLQAHHALFKYSVGLARRSCRIL